MAKKQPVEVNEEKITKPAPASKAKVEKVEKVEKASDPAENDDAPVASSGVVDRSKYSYTTNKEVKTASGRASVDNDDPLAAALRGKTSEEVINLVAVNGGTVNPKWNDLNQGLARMSAGNVLRKLAKRTEGIKIDGKTLAIAA